MNNNILPVNRDLANHSSATIRVPVLKTITAPSAVLHFGIGNFHRSHQAFLFQKLRELDPERYGHWTVTGVGFLPADLPFINQLRQQDGLYCLETAASSGSREAYLINTIQRVLQVDDEENYDTLIELIASPDTQIISLTITEGGYFIDFDKYTFDIENKLIRSDLENRSYPKSVFGVLAKGLSLRKARNAGEVTLLSCDNILKNGNALKFALESFTEKYDPTLLDWLHRNVTFPNSMVDRITPATSDNDRTNFTSRYGINDKCLVLSEDFFQWVIEAGEDSILYPLSEVGVTFVGDVHPYEEMKLGILNGGHTLVGLCGDALSYYLINTAVRDKLISNLYDHYIASEVIPVLTPITGVDFRAYYHTVRDRFANPLIPDSTARIISGSSDKIPKFILPVISKQLRLAHPKIEIAVFVIALWWLYLEKEFKRNGMADVQDNLKAQWIGILDQPESAKTAFVHYRPVFGALVEDPRFTTLLHQYITDLQLHSAKEVVKSVIDSKK